MERLILNFRFVLQKIRQHSTKLLFFVINGLVATIIVLLIKDADYNKEVLVSSDNLDVSPSDSAVLDSQSQITADETQTADNFIPDKKQEELVPVPLEQSPPPVLPKAPAKNSNTNQNVNSAKSNKNSNANSSNSNANTPSPVAKKPKANKTTKTS